MKTKLTVLALSIAAAITLTLTGCATKLAAPVITPANPATGAPAVTNYYVPNSAVMQGVAYTNAAAPLIPAPWGTAATAIATLAALIAGYIAQQKNSQANASAGAAAWTVAAAGAAAAGAEAAGAAAAVDAAGVARAGR